MPDCLRQSERHLLSILSFMSFFTVCFTLDPAALAFVSRLPGVLYQRLSENPDKECPLPPKLPSLYFTSPWCVTILFKWKLSLSLQFAFASLTLYSVGQSRPCPFATGFPSLECSAGDCLRLPDEDESWELLLSRREVGRGALRMAQSHPGEAASRIPW